MVVILPVEVEAASTIYSTQTGDWKDTATWLGGVVPGTTDTAIICDGHTVTLDDNRTVKFILINITATLQIGDTTPLWDVTLTFDDSVGAGFHGSGDGTLITKGTATYGMTLRSVNNPPTTQWNLGLAGELVTMDWTTVQDHNKAGGNDFWDVENTTFTHSGTDYVVHLQYLTKFANVTISTTTGHGMYMADEFLEYYNVVITSGAGKYDLRVEARLEFQYSNFDTSKVVFGGLIPAGGTGNYTSMKHNDIVTAYKIGTGTLRAPQHLKKSTITHDFDSTFDVEIVQGSLGIDENADARAMFVSSGAYLNHSTGTTFDLSNNLTNNGTFLTDGTITDSGGYFDFYNTNPGAVWLNNSTVSKAKLAYYHSGFNFSLGISSNSTINDWTLESPVDAQFNITYYDFNNKASGTIWHMNVTASSGSVKFVTGNLTSGETYTSYIESVSHTKGIADSGNYYNFSYSGWSTKHIYLTRTPPDRPGGGIITGIGATFDYIIISENTVEFRAQVLGFSEGRDIPVTYYWTFSDATTSNEKNPTKTFEYGGITSNADATLIVCNDKYCSAPVEKSVHLIRWWLIVLILAAIITPIILGMKYVDRKR